MSGSDTVGRRIKISSIAMPVEGDGNLLQLKVCERLGMEPEAVKSIKILRRALDARGNRPPVLVHTIGVELAPGMDAGRFDPWPEDQPEPELLSVLPTARPIVVGAGPAGIFAALRLSSYGLKPLILERGEQMGRRVLDVAGYWKTGEPKPESNVQFGEGGAGAFSDGKLTSRSKDPRKEWVLQKLVEAGAKRSILFDAKPHLGTSRIRTLFSDLRHKLEVAGAEYRFGVKVTGLLMDGGRVAGVSSTGGDVRGGPVFLAVGHSARDVYSFLPAHGVRLVPKGFAVGLRVEAEQRAIDLDRFGDWAHLPGMEPAEFALARKSRSGRGVYSFCMCPGGIVIPAATGSGELVINGMSGPLRSGRFANAALVVEVRPEDFGNAPQSGIAFQRKYEAAAYAIAGERAVPSQSVASFLGRRGEAPGETSCPWPLKEADLRSCLPGFAAEALAECLPALISEVRPLGAGRLLGVETRTSSPVRIERGTDMEAVATPRLYPVGEGAGYAGGIISSAIDGIRAVDCWIEKVKGNEKI